jgi:type IV pilus assembly protein PilB
MAPVEVKKRLGEMLVAAGLIQDVQLRKVLDEQKKRGGRVGELLVELRLITENDLAVFLARQLGLPFVDLDKHLVDREAVKLIPIELARRLSAIPLLKDEASLEVAMADPLDIFGLDDIRRAAGVEIRQAVAARSGVQRAIDRYYSMAPVIEAATMDFSGSAIGSTVEFGEEAAIPDVVSEDSPVVKLVNMVIAQAILDRASDIHISPEANEIKIRYRIDGVLREVRTVPREMHAPIVSRIKILANMDIAEKRVPQDGRFQVQVSHTDSGPVVTSVFRERQVLRITGDAAVDIRVSTLPVIQGETVVMRLLSREHLITNLDGLGFNIEMLDRYRKMILRPYGMVLVTGPTGSGKTTTLYASLQSLDRKSHHVVTIEDPVEYQVNDVNQLQVNAKAGVTFANGLRSILRQDPDIIMVGEIRDRETAEIAVHAALTGHLVFSTLHTNNAAGAVTRLIDMGIEPFLISSSVVGIIGQRLVRKICDHCRKAYHAPGDLLRSLGMPPGLVTFYRGEGCKACNNTGYQSRIGLYEFMEISEAIRGLITAKASTSALQSSAGQAGFKTIRQEGLRKAVAGTTTVEEVLRVTQEAEGV